VRWGVGEELTKLIEAMWLINIAMMGSTTLAFVV
jgi:hypothetical protein